ncbi:MAG: hypothetical protein ACXW1C_05550 [Gallionella sp.]
MSDEQDIIAYKTRRASAQNALRKIAVIVRNDQQNEANKTRYVRKFLRYGVPLFALLALVVWLLREL